MTNLDVVRNELMAQASAATHGRAASLVHSEGPLRQTVLALTEGTELAEHEAPHAASMQVLLGRVRVSGGDESIQVAAGELSPLIRPRHSVRALEDSVFLLTVVTVE